MNYEPFKASPRDPVDAAAAWLLRLCDHEPDEVERAEFVEWDQAADNHAAFIQALETWHAMDDVANEPWLAELMQEARAARHRHFHRQPPRRWMLAAACVALVLFVAGGVWWYAASPVTYSTGIGERRVVQLGDGSQISLDADTRVEVAYSRDHRRLRLLQGRVACDVAKDPLRPFSVRARNKVVVATGTEFSVELVSNQVRVVLYEGHVAVLDVDQRSLRPEPVRLAGSPEAADSVLVPGRELVVAARADAATVNRVNPAQSIAWEQGLLYFNNEPLGTAIQRINRYSAAQIAVGSADAARVRVSGVFEAGNTAAFISGVTAVFPIRAVDRKGVETLELRGR